MPKRDKLGKKITASLLDYRANLAAEKDLAKTVKQIDPKLMRKMRQDPKTMDRLWDSEDN